MSISEGPGPSGGSSSVRVCTVSAVACSRPWWTATLLTRRLASKQTHRKRCSFSIRRDVTRSSSVVSDRDLPRILERGLSVDLDFYTEYLDRARAADPDYRGAGSATSSK